MDSSRQTSESTKLSSMGSHGNVPNTPWPALDPASDSTAHESALAGDAAPTGGAARTRSVSLQQTPQGPTSSKATSRRRFFSFSRGLARLRRATNTDAENAEASSDPQPPAANSEGESQDIHAQLNTGMSADNSASIVSTNDNHQLQIAKAQAKPALEPVATMKTAIRIISEYKMLKYEDVQEMWVAVEIEGAMHNRRRRAEDDTIDLALVIDNSYYVSQESLIRALDTVSGALSFLHHGDRIALYVTHCTHGLVSDTVPEKLFPLTPFSQDIEDALRRVMSTVEKSGSQAWNPPRPNPSTADVVLAVAKSLEMAVNKREATHVVILSPTVNAIHRVSDEYPDLHVHQVNTAILPYRHIGPIQDPTCPLPCCKNMYSNNWMHYQSLTSRMRQILYFARSEVAQGDLTDIRTRVYAKKGCEILEYLGSRDTPMLKLGQTYTYFVRIRITRKDTEELDVDSDDPNLTSSLDSTFWREDLRACQAAGASLSHLLSARSFTRTSLFSRDEQLYSEAQLVVMKELGKMTYPMDTYMELHARLLFHRFSRLDVDKAKAEIDKLIVEMEAEEDKAKDSRLARGRHRDLKTFIERMTTEIYRNGAVREYELRSRQQLPVYPGPVRIAVSPHQWLVSLWKPTKRYGMAL